MKLNQYHHTFFLLLSVNLHKRVIFNLKKKIQVHTNEYRHIKRFRTPLQDVKSWNPIPKTFFNFKFHISYFYSTTKHEIL